MLIDLQTALDHLRADADDARVAPLLAASELFTLEVLDRNVYADQDALDAAIAAAPAALADAKTAYAAALTAACELTDCDLREKAKEYARNAWSAACEASDRAQFGMVLNDNITAAILLYLEYLYDGTATVPAVEALLQPHRRLGA